MRFSKSVLLLTIFLLAFTGCRKSLPTQKDGSLQVKIVVSDTSPFATVEAALGYAPLRGATVSLTSRKYYDDNQNPVAFRMQSDSNGVAIFENVDAGMYTVFTEGSVEVADTITGFNVQVELAGAGEIEVLELMQVDTVEALAASASPLVINEVYFTGPPNKAFYFYDQFIELYNASDENVYLDGLIVGRGRPYHHPDMETMDFVQAIYLYQFPGEPGGSEYALLPGEFAVVACDAIDHSSFPGLEQSVDLSNADWEFYNPYRGDWDAPAPNVVNAVPERSVDFYISLAHNTVILAEGDGWYFGEWSESGYQYMHIPLDDVVDVVEYSSNPDKQKEVTTRVDAGFAGIGIAKYDGQSTERRILGSDTNNSSIDFVTIEKPTPGYQHE